MRCNQSLRMWMLPCGLRGWLIAASLALAGTSASGGALDEPHLSTLPRSPQETASVHDATTILPRTSVSEGHPAGDATVVARTDNAAFSQPSNNLDFEQFLKFRQGNILFHKQWAPAPSPDREFDGLGPVYNARSCQMCHIRDGRGNPPGPDEVPISLALKLARPSAENTDTEGIQGYRPTRPDPTYGWQLQNFGLAGHRAEYTLALTYEEVRVRLNDDEVAFLRRPVYGINNLGYGPLHPDTRISPRIAPQMIGLGLLETIPASDILANTDPDDRDGNGISGRANIVWSEEFSTPMLGRFGHKASAPTIRQQSARALTNDLGLSSSLYPFAWGDCTQSQIKCRAAARNGEEPGAYEVDETTLNLLVYYSRNLAVPARQSILDPTVEHGRALFHELGCSDCHIPGFVTHKLANRPEQAAQLIWPFSDLLLHDMGADLADDLPEGRATGPEWRTAPLWGIGRVQQVNPRAGFLHDGRARTMLEAILWHGGEAQPMRDAVIALPKDERAALIRFLESL